MSKGKEIAEQGIEAISKIFERIYDTLVGSYVIERQYITILCNSNTHKASFVIRGKAGTIHQKKIRFTTGKPRSVSVRSLTSTSSLANSVQYLDDGFELSTDAMSEHDLVMVDVEYPIDSPEYLDMIIDSHSDKETPKGENSEFWMHAQLKDPVLFRRNYGIFDVKDFELVVEVPVSNYIVMGIPRAFRVEMDALSEFTRSSNPHEDVVLARRYSLARRNRGGKEFQALLSDMQTLFTAKKFSTFVDVDPPFAYEESIKGSSYYETIPFPTWPKFMKVIATTDLSLDHYASDGTLVFNRSKFSSEVRKILDEKK